MKRGEVQEKTMGSKTKWGVGKKSMPHLADLAHAAQKRVKGVVYYGGC